MSPRRLPPSRLLALAGGGACISFSAVTFASAILLATAHVGDAYGVDHVGGIWIALARAASEGTLYPPLYDGESYGGTRYMPVPILLHGGLGLILDDYLVAGKLISLAFVAALLVLVVAVLRGERCPLPVALLLASALIVTSTGLTAAFGIRHDTLPVILQLAAVAIATRSTGRAALLGAALLAALALSAKLSAIWAPLAIGCWLLVRQRSRLPAFAGAFLGFSVLILGLFEAISHGRLTENVVGLGFSGSRGFESLSWEQNRIRFILADGLGAFRFVVALALLVVVVGLWRRRATIYAISLAISLPILGLILSDRGSFSNQLLDLQVLSVVALGAGWQGLRPVLRAGVVAAVLTIGVSGFVENVHPLAAAQALVDRDTSRLPEAARGLRPDVRLLSEDPYVPVALGQKPVVLDPFMLWSIARAHPDWRDALVSRLAKREFQAVLLFYRPEDQATSDSVRFWYSTQHFGPEIVAAIERNYRVASRAGGLWIYRPRPSR